MLKNNQHTDLMQCPFCGCDTFYSKDYITGATITYHRYDGKETENGQMYEHVKHTTGKYAYCTDCDKRLFNMETGKLLNDVRKKVKEKH